MAGILFLTLLPISTLVIIEKNKSKLIIFFIILGCSFFMLLISSRFAGISLFLGSMYFLYLNYNKRVEEDYTLLFAVGSLGMFLIMLFYIKLENTGFVKQLDDLSWSLFNKSIFSGRSYMWKDLLRIIESKPYFDMEAFKKVLTFFQLKYSGEILVVIIFILRFC